MVHFIFIYIYLIANTQFLDDYPYFYFVELEICIILWCFMLIHTIKDYTSLRALIVPLIYFYMIFILNLMTDVYYEKRTVSDSISTLGTIQWIAFTVSVSLILIIKGIKKLRRKQLLHFYFNPWLFIIRSILLVRYFIYFLNSSYILQITFVKGILIVMVSIDGWNPYKIRFFSMLLTQYINLSP